MGTVTCFSIANMYHFAILLLALGVSSQDSFDCGDYSYNICHDPPPAQELHVDSLEECIQNCDLFGSFDQCDYLMYYGDQGTDENCKLIADPNGSGTPEEEMQKYLDNCRVTGQPLTTDGTISGACIPNPHTGECSPFCTGDCFTECDKCDGYQGALCDHVGDPDETVELLPNMDACFGSLNLIQDMYELNYMVWDAEQEECLGYNEPKYNCKIQVVRNGVTMDQVSKCESYKRMSFK